MYSKLLELSGLTLIAVGVGLLAGEAAGLITAGLVLAFVGSATDDRAVTASLRRGAHYLRFLWYRQVAKEDGVLVPQLRQDLPCDCRGQDADCPLCFGSGWMPNPNLRDSEGPHPPIHVDPQAQAQADRLARMREQRAKGLDRTAALSRRP